MWLFLHIYINYSDHYFDYRLREIIKWIVVADLHKWI